MTNATLLVNFRTERSKVFHVITGSLIRDCEFKETLDSMTSECIDQLKLMPEKHGENMLNIRSKAEQCITEDYQVKLCSIR